MVPARWKVKVSEVKVSEGGVGCFGRLQGAKTRLKCVCSRAKSGCTVSLQVCRQRGTERKESSETHLSRATN